MARNSKLALTKEGVKLASLASLSELHQNTRIVSGEFWTHLINRSIDENDMTAAKIIADRLLPQRTVADHAVSAAKDKPKITINISPLEARNMEKVIEHE